MTTGDHARFTDCCYGNEPHNGMTGTVTITNRDEFVVRFDDGACVWAMEKELVLV